MKQTVRGVGVGRTSGRRLGIVAAVGFVWRLALLVVDKWDQELLFNDSIYYSEWAKQLTRVASSARCSTTCRPPSTAR